MTDRAGWFSDRSDEQDADDRAPWQPFVQVSGGCFPLPLWFTTQAACDEWIARYLPDLGRRLDGPSMVSVPLADLLLVIGDARSNPYSEEAEACARIEALIPPDNAEKRPRS